jgi:hypothetical protein
MGGLKEAKARLSSVLVEGSRRPLVPLRRPHVNQSEAERGYDNSMFPLRIWDDGKGIGSSVLQEARVGVSRACRSAPTE